MTNYFAEIQREEDLHGPLAEMLKRKYNTHDVEIVHKKKEQEHGCDIIVTLPDACKIGFQVKITDLTTYNDDFKKCVRDAHDYEFETGNIRKLSQFIWITTKGVTSLSSDYYRITKKLKFYKDIEFWDGTSLFEKFLTHYPAAFRSIKINFLQKKIEQLKIDRHKYFAAHLQFEVLHLLSELNTHSDRWEEIRSCINDAVCLTADVRDNTSFFKRTLNLFYRQYEFFVSRKIIIGDDLNINIESFKDCEHYKEFQILYPDTHSLLFDFFFILDQLNILKNDFLSGPAGLSSIQTLRLLLRAGFPVSEQIEKRLNRLYRELDKEDRESIDGKCSLCTGTAFSILGLLGDKGYLDSISSWLHSLKDKKYVNIELADPDEQPQEHGYHYTASVLLGFLDNGDLAGAKSCFDCFFDQNNLNEEEVFKNWMRYRNITRADAIAYIFSTFTYYGLLTGKETFPEEKKGVLKHTFKKLVAYLQENAEDVATAWKQYETRDNISCFSLAMFVGLGTPEVLEFYLKNIRSLRNLSTKFLRKEFLLDSNHDRTRKRIEGWLLYWEVLLTLQDAGEDISKYLVKDAMQINKNAIN